ncbi:MULTISPECIES: MutH/Sau3AI family endonuclease [unclassified Bacillus (in: firmicutes)]|uniref:MutH/Sau3AI family endonuclease n=1 Tax=unclassified Bacillus (in: firmicutes) TaxID=185979 RepID=UPI000BF2646A|nr:MULTISPECIES: MutH/Sau3AI family endonuclease [unclassified Bacillus (in: firmicutes)]PEU11309.1 restriction endonuclease [Bacillus sp. AFS014408]PFW57978.1 restriction endonuclease [Bacillus sp. AFS075034]
MALHKFERKELNRILSNAVGKTLGDVDVNNVFTKTITSPKITGIAGDVVEQSILGYPADSDKNPDLIVDGIDTELKTTGIRNTKRKSDFIYEAKEPMSITAVSPQSITNEEFETSSFWHKLEHLLLVYYHYDSPETVPAAEYANFFIKGYHFHEFSEEDKEILKNDWLIVRDFIQHLKDTYKDPKTEYPRISSELRKNLMLIDTAPKYPNPPRFRLKRTTVSTIVQKHFGIDFEELDETYSTFNELDDELHRLTQKYKDKTVQELIDELDIDVKLNAKGDVSKGVTEQILIKMFGGEATKLSKIDLFSKIGIIPKSVVQTKNGSRTEDMKLFQIDFEEWTDLDIPFEESFVYSYFNGQQFLCIMFEEPSSKTKLLDNKFIGFKRLAIDEHVLENDIRIVWKEIRDLVNNNKLKEEPILDKKGIQRITPKTKLPMTAPNFPKSKNHSFFVRGSGTDASKKPFELNGISMYAQYLWMKGSIVVSMLKNIDFI